MKSYIVPILLLFNILLAAQDHKQDSLNNLVAQAKAEKNWKGLSELYLAQSNLFYKSEDYGLAVPLLLKIDSISQTHNIKNSTSVLAILARAEISKLTFTKESSQVAYSLGKEALKLAEEINSQESIHRVYVKLADYCQLTKRYEEAKLYVDKGLKYYLSKNDGDEDKISRLYLIESAYYLERNNQKKGEESRYKAVLYLEGKGQDFEMAKAKYYYGHYLRYDKKEYQKALVFLEESKILFQTTDNIENEIYHRCLRDLAICYDAIGNYKNSSIYYREAYELKIELNKKANRSFSRNLETQYETEKKKRAIELLTTQKSLVEKQKTNQRNLFLGGLGFAAIAGLFFFLQFKNRQKIAKKLQELDTLKSNFFANISHEFRTPLTLISSPIDDALVDQNISDQKRNQFVIAKQNADRLLELVNQLLDLSKIDAGQLKLHLQQGNVLQLISALSDSFSYYAKQKRIEFNIEIQASEEPVWYDKDAIEKITVNLLSNAIKYTPENGAIVCRAYIANTKLFLEVKNSGKGLTPLELRNIFNRFYQTNEQNQGSGIGLALVSELVELHKGKIEVESTLNKETSFNLSISIDKNSFKKDAILVTSNNEVENTLPLYTSPSIEEDEEFKDSDLPILLIVEDNDDLRNLLKQSFENNYNVITAPNGKIGVELALEHIPDLIISDIMMPEKDGITLTEELKTDERSAHIPIILLTAKAEAESQFKGIDTGADDYITKPFDKKLLILKVEKLIESRRQLQARYSQELVLLPKDIAITNLDEKFLEKVQVTLDKSLVDPSFNVTEFSEAVGMSRMQLHRKLKALTGLTASEFIRSQRLKLATEFLKASDINMSQVGYSVGFNDHSYFTKCFKETYNCTPSEFAKRS